MPTTPNFGFRYPDRTYSGAVYTWIEQLAEDADAALTSMPYPVKLINVNTTFDGFVDGSLTVIATSPVFAVPAWKQDGTHTMTMSVNLNALIITDDAEFSLFLNVLSSAGARSLVSGNATTTPEGANGLVTWSGSIPSGTTSFQATITAQRSLGTSGALRISGSSGTGGAAWDLVIT